MTKLTFRNPVRVNRRNKLWLKEQGENSMRSIPNEKRPVRARRKRLVAACVIAGALASCATSIPLAAQTTWTEPGVGDWFTDSNWSANSPGGADDAFLNNGGTAQVQAAGAVARQLTVGTNASDSGRLEVLTNGVLTMLTNPNSVTFGDAGNSTLLVSGGGNLSSGFTIFGNATGSVSNASLTGNGSLFYGDRSTVFGWAGQANVEVTSGAKIIGNSSISSGFAASGNAHLAVSGAGSEVIVNGSSGFLTVANNGTASLTISDNGKVTANSSISIASNFGATGNVLVTGEGSLLKSNTASFTVGAGGRGVATFQSGGDLQAVRALIGTTLANNNPNYGNGTLTLTGEGTSAAFAGSQAYISVGQSGIGLLQVLNGADVTLTNRLTIGDAAVGNGTALFRGANTTVVSTNVNEIGYDGVGMLTVDQGATLNGTIGYLGVRTTANGTIVGNGTGTISGNGSAWNLSNNLRVGDGGRGLLLIADAATVRVNNGTGTANIARQATGQGRLQIGNGGAAGVLAAAAVQFGSGNGVLAFNHSDTTTFAATINGTGTIEKSGSGTTRFTGASLFTGLMKVLQGRAVVNAAFANTTAQVSNGAVLGGNTTGIRQVELDNGSVFDPGSDAGVVGSFYAGNFLWKAGAVLRFQLGLASGPTSSDQLVVSGLFEGDAGLSGPGGFAFEFSDGDGVYTAGTIYDLVVFGSQSGFDTVGIPFGQTADPEGILEASLEVPGPLASFNTDAFSYTYSGALGTLDGYFQFDDNRLQFVVMPEPGSGMLALAGAAGFALRRRRRS